MTMLSILSPATSTSLTTLATIKAELGLTSGADDDWLTGAISRVSADIGRFCNRVFGLEQVSETFRLRQPADRLMLSRFPLMSIDSITEAGAALAADAWEADSAAGGMLYRLDGDERVRWCAGKVTVTYTAGYRLPGDPLRDLLGDVETAAVQLVKMQWYGRTRDPSVRNETITDVSAMSYRETLPAEIERLLSQHRHIPMG